MFRDLERVDGPFVGIAAHRYIDASLAFEGETATGSAIARVGQYFPLLGVQARRGSFARCQRRSRRRRGERRRAELRVLGVGVRRRSGRRRPHSRRQRQAADDRRRRAARFLRHDRRRATARVRADHVPLALAPERVPAARGSQELLGLSVRALEAGRLARASGSGDQRAVQHDRQRRRCAAR